MWRTLMMSHKSNKNCIKEQWRREERGEDDAMALVTSWQWIAMRDPLWLSTWSSHDSTIGAAFNVCRHYVYVDFLFAFLFAFAASPALFDKISLSRHFMRDAANKWPQTERCEKCSLCVCGNFAIVIMDSNTYSNKCLYVCKQLTIIQNCNTEMHYYCQGSGPETFPAYQPVVCPLGVLRFKLRQNTCRAVAKHSQACQCLLPFMYNLLWNLWGIIWRSHFLVAVA